MNKISKRLTLILTNIVGMFAISITMIKSFYAFCAGRLVFGACIATWQTVGPTFLVMTIPSELMVVFGPFINILINLGVFLASVLSYMLP